MSIEVMKQALVALEVATTPLAKDRQEVLRAQAALRLAIEQAKKQEPLEWLTGCPECGADSGCDCDEGTWNPPAPQRQPPKFPTMLRKMWSGREVQAWIDEHWQAPPQRQPLDRSSKELSMKSIRAFWLWLRFGTVTSKVVSDINGVSCEVAYYGRGGRMVGYWAYGYYDPAFPYQGR